VGIYVVLKLDNILIDYAVSDYPNLITTYRKTPSSPLLLRINLPVIGGEQQTIPYAGQWTITLYNDREEQRQSISKVLRPKADL